MRYVPYNPSTCKFPEGWEEKATQARDAVAAASPAMRSKVISEHQDLWKSLKPELAKLLHGKCWYTEALQIGTDTDVDHYRPKGSVKGVYRDSTGEAHPGYWWYAFEPANFRFSCIVANRLRRDIATGNIGGKANEFPLWDESRRAWHEADDCSDEQPLLIDPCDPVDVKLITFGENGEAIPRHNATKKPRLFKKAERSIVLYHLNHSDFVKARIGMRDRIRHLIGLAQKLYKRFDSADPDIELSYKTVIKQLRDACSADAPFSSFAISLIELHRFDESLSGVLD